MVETMKAVKTTKMNETECTAKTQPLLDCLEKYNNWLDEVPPIEQPMRFGNKAFRTWMDKIIASAEEDI
jgi:hypothetical protein